MNKRTIKSTLGATTKHEARDHHEHAITVCTQTLYKSSIVVTGEPETQE